MRKRIYTAKDFENCLNISLGETASLDYAKLPLVFLTCPLFENVGMAEIVAYSFLRNRLNLSIKNNFIDDNGYFLIMSCEEFCHHMKDMSLATGKRLLNKLKEHGLVTTKRQAYGKNQKIYVTDISRLMRANGYDVKDHKCKQCDIPETVEVEERRPHRGIKNDTSTSIKNDTSTSIKTEPSLFPKTSQSIKSELSVSVKSDTLPSIKSDTCEKPFSAWQSIKNEPHTSIKNDTCYIEKERHEKERLKKELSPKGDSKKRPNPKKKFVPPTESEILDYAVERNMDVNDFMVKMELQKFFNYYESNGWTQGKSAKPIVSWKAAMRSWFLRVETWKKEQQIKSEPKNEFAWMDTIFEAR